VSFITLANQDIMADEGPIQIFFTLGFGILALAFIVQQFAWVFISGGIDHQKGYIEIDIPGKIVGKHTTTTIAHVSGKAPMNDDANYFIQVETGDCGGRIKEALTANSAMNTLMWVRGFYSPSSNEYHTSETHEINVPKELFEDAELDKEYTIHCTRWSTIFETRDLGCETETEECVKRFKLPTDPFTHTPKNVFGTHSSEMHVIHF